METGTPKIDWRRRCDCFLGTKYELQSSKDENRAVVKSAQERHLETRSGLGSKEWKAEQHASLRGVSCTKGPVGERPNNGEVKNVFD